MWKGRKAAFAAMGRISPNYIVQDGVIPRTALPRVLNEIDRMAAAVSLRVANVFHAGDGNLHPLVLYDRAIEGQEEMALDLSYRILHLCVDSGGSITGEHGVGKEKQEALGYMFSEPDLAHHATGALRLRSGEHFQSRQGLPAAHGCARRSRALQAAPAGNGRHRGDLLMSTTAALTLARAHGSSGGDRRAGAYAS